MSVYRAIYTSQPFGFDTGILHAILLDAQRANARDDISGALICRADIYLQWLEGPEPAVKDALARIARDDRHLNMRMRVEGTIPERMFGEWAMLHDPAVSWIWTQKQVADGAVDRATAAEIEAFFPPLRDLATMQAAD
ncbi:Sensors of blue-light using FAD [Rhodobacteraceae bacterium THAF1]|uniref:BLUF domain-containing protein n=1 Tax=Palleronia sp. THAF1 TaxID=2587842 RepID=UPI000F3E00E1|nr:BLUF domain-containing protein [Palleronia sp. THAF1]QFU07835.1 Blue light- and temperature-regulated antirepressor YcgF [Palleronia sp. THAF1]VDC25660.1 Sensors of blue-light using FAD [Rhodobacteraceae bacterium THAF1]